MTTPITGIAPFFIVRNVPAALAFYRDRLGFDITFQGPEPEPWEYVWVGADVLR